MIGARCLAAALAAAALLSPAAAAPRSPAEIVRELQHLQDRIATGDTVAEAAYGKSIQRAAAVFAAAPQSAWKDRRNTRALIVYLFSGGDAPAVEDIAPPSAVAPELASLYQGALAYGLGIDDEARNKLASIDPRSVPNDIGGHLALVQATLCAQENRVKALGLLDLARLLEPGTLVEEAALRKEMSLIGAIGDLDKFALLSRRYRDAFPHSIYADNFRILVATAAVELGAADTDEAAVRLKRLMTGLDKLEQRRLYLLIARKAVIAGRAYMAVLAGNEAGRLSQGAPAEEARASVYFGAAAIVGDKYDIGLKALQSVAPERLEPRDRALRTSALAVAATIRETRGAAAAPDPKTDPRLAVMADAEQSLTAADTLLNSIAK